MSYTTSEYMDAIEALLQELGLTDNATLADLDGDIAFKAQRAVAAIRQLYEEASAKSASRTPAFLALKYGGRQLPLEVLHSAAGWYLGTVDPLDRTPNSRESAEYWKDASAAHAALASGKWTQREAL